MWIYSYRFDLGQAVYELGVAHWPRAVIVFMAITATLCFVERVSRGGENDSTDDEGVDQAVELGKGAASSARFGFASSAPLSSRWSIYGLCRAWGNTTPLFLASYIYLFGETRWKHVVGASFAIYGLMLLVFSKLLYVPLPAGNWPGFYDFSNALLIFLGSG